MTITVECHTAEAVSHCVLTGELDLTTEAQVRRALFNALTSRPQTLVIDLGDVTFIDSTGLRVLLSARNRAAGIGTRVVLSNISPAVGRTLEIANLHGFFEFDANAGR